MGKYQPVTLLPLFFFPVFIIISGHISFKFILQKLILVSPFAILVGIFNPWLDTRPYYDVYGFTITYGWLSFLVILLKFILTVSTALILIATTSFNGICIALNKLKVPWIFVNQLTLLYRYLFVLIKEASFMVRARNLRSFKNRGKGLKPTTKLIATLFVRTLDKSEHIYCAMTSRGYQGKLPILNELNFNISDFLFILIFCILFIFLKFYNQLFFYL